ncbi:hypothetical protein [Campylobacter sp.]|uniref:hypothetical protein n=1 Tax=Campylobacter sp. TaxID=205 RepID=UPI0025C139CB|nr:hypothetical protein [Campylobacter sp.]
MVIISIIVMIIIAIWTIICGAFWILIAFILFCVILPSLFLIEKYGIINVAVSYVLILVGVMALINIIKNKTT